MMHIGNTTKFKVASINIIRINISKKNTSISRRHSFEYIDKDETIVAHLVGAIDAFFKISADWPLSSYGLKLISIRNTGTQPTNITLNLFCKTKVKMATPGPKQMLIFSIYVAALHMNSATFE